MEPRIQLGKKYRCKKTVIMKGVNRGEKSVKTYIEGKTYPCEVASSYPSRDDPDRMYCFGHITDEQGNKWHAWPYDPILNPICHDKWTEYFVEL